MKNKIKLLCFLMVLGAVACQQEEITTNEELNLEIENRNTPCSHCAFVVEVEYKQTGTHGDCCDYEVYARVEEPCGQQFYLGTELVYEAWTDQDVFFPIQVCGPGPSVLRIFGQNEFGGGFVDLCYIRKIECE